MPLVFNSRRKTKREKYREGEREREGENSVSISKLQSNAHTRNNCYMYCAYIDYIPP